MTTTENAFAAQSEELGWALKELRLVRFRIEKAEPLPIRHDALGQPLPSLLDWCGTLEHKITNEITCLREES